MLKAFTTNKSLKGADLKQKRAVVITGHSLQITSALLTHGLVAFQVFDVWFCLQLLRTSTASVSVFAAAAVFASAAAHLVPQPLSPPCFLPSAPLSAAAGLSSKLSCCWCFLNKMRALIPARSRMLQKTATDYLPYRL